MPTLATALQAAEAAHDPVYAAKDPWYDGHRPEHGHTLVTTPRGGTQLSERAVLRVVKKWAYARSVASSWRGAGRLGSIGAARVDRRRVGVI